MLLGQYEAELFDLKTITRARPVSLKPPIQHLLCIDALKGAWGACTRRLFWRLFFWRLTALIQTTSNALEWTHWNELLRLKKGGIVKGGKGVGAVSSRSFDLLNSMIYGPRWSVYKRWMIEHGCYIHPLMILLLHRSEHFWLVTQLYYHPPYATFQRPENRKIKHSIVLQHFANQSTSNGHEVNILAF